MPTLPRLGVLAPLVLACAGLFACQAQESGVEQGPTGDGSGEPTVGASSPDSDSDPDSGLDDTSGTDVVPPARSYFIAESTDFTGNDCENADVNEVTASLRQELDDEGWVGTRATNGQTRPLDFIDPVKRDFGQDHTKSDAVSLAVFAGHGWMDRIQWGTQDDTPTVEPPEKRCRALFSEDIRLGAMSGGWARAVAVIASCTGRLACYESTLGTNDVTQVFAFNNSPSIRGNQMRRFYRKSNRMPNRDAWLAAMDNRPGFGKNSPVVYTRGTGRDEVLQTHRQARLSEIEEIPGEGGTTWYAYSWVDHGLEGSCTPLQNSCVGVDG